MKKMCIGMFAIGLFVPVSSPPLGAAVPCDQFLKVKVVDSRTGHGVPMVKLATGHRAIFYTDSQGIAAVCEPGLMGKDVWVNVSSFGYTLSSSGGGDTLTFEPGGSSVVELNRDMVARRLYRVTGQGIYRDSHLLGEEVPMDDPLLNARVTSLGKGKNAVFQDKLYWFWSFGAGQPDGNFQFKMSGATSQLPRWGGLDPDTGVNLNYFQTAGGTVREMLPLVEGVILLKNLMVTTSDGQSSMYAYYRAIKNQLLQEHGIAKWDEASQEFNVVTTFPKDMKASVCPNVARVRTAGREWFYFSCPFPITRVPANPASLKDPDRYQTFTIVKSGEGWQGADTTSLNQKGFLNGPKWVWDTGAATVNNRREAGLIQAGRLTRWQGIHHLTDVIGGDTFIAHQGTVYWSDFRQKWVMLTNEYARGGRVWYAEADSPIGPWVYAREVATHSQNQSYNKDYLFSGVKQHPYYTNDSGTRVYFSGVFKSNLTTSRPVPRYDANHLMYGLNLTDPRLHLPTAVYVYEDVNGLVHYGTSTTFTDVEQDSGMVPFYAYAPDRHDRPPVDPLLAADDGQSDTLPIPFWEKKVAGEPTTILTSDSSSVSSDTPAFYAWPLDVEFKDSRRIVKLNRYDSGTRTVYVPTNYEHILSNGWTNKGAIAKVWSSPRLGPPRNPYAEPVQQCLGSSAVCE